MSCHVTHLSVRIVYRVRSVVLTMFFIVQLLILIIIQLLILTETIQTLIVVERFYRYVKIMVFHRYTFFIYSNIFHLTLEKNYLYVRNFI